MPRSCKCILDRAVFKGAMSEEDRDKIMRNIKMEWIPVTERLPNSNGCYLVWRPHFFGGEIGMPSICYFDGQNTWHDSYGVDFNRVLSSGDVVAWMPLPEPYEGSEEE